MNLRKSIVLLIFIIVQLICNSVFAVSQDEAKEELQKRLTPFRNDLMNSFNFLGAVMQGDKQGAQLWLDAGFDINYKNLSNQSSLEIVTINGNVNAVKMLLELGADANVKGQEERTPLMMAANLHQLEIAKILISNGADVNAKTIKGGTALFYSAVSNDKDIMQLLLSKGADPSIINKEGVSVYSILQANGNIELLQMLKGKDGVKDTSITGPNKKDVDQKTIDEAIKGTKIKKGADSFDGTFWYYVSDTETNFWEGSTVIRTMFNMFYPAGKRNLIVAYENCDAYAIDPSIQMKIDNVIWNVSTDVQNTSYNGDYKEVKSVFAIPNDLYEALMKTKGDITVRFTYNTLGGHYMKEYKIPVKLIMEMQKMYNICQ